MAGINGFGAGGYYGGYGMKSLRAPKLQQNDENSSTVKKEEPKRKEPEQLKSPMIESLQRVLEENIKRDFGISG